ncbi:MAG TPA: hypothetical protein HA282_04020 [Nanoarchaeota archaeon]|nr:MAG: Orotate phosphoribosyltransferase [archaeon GW2011_AR6]MBS3082379.1 hypothetical protein [Candidatus Pacearchaeota archaeon]HIH17914.1 hypothetical protein [Nanoarchaeota archaeon]HIH33715.1 hypothetical protein [Nanoarchaeota archaeon]HIH51175.1 hypothetical protein [Nanoarchaeota archaeon]
MDGYKHQKEEYARDITLGLYRKGFIETLWNTESKEHAEKGWTLKGGIWSPFYINLRPIGSEPELVAKIGKALSLFFIHELLDYNKIVGIEMAGIPIAAATSVAGNICRGDCIPYLYTRPLPEPARTPDDAREILTHASAGKWGEKSFLEGRLYDEDKILLLDDVVSDFGSKLIAREIVMYEAEKRGVTVSCDSILVVFDREQGAQAKADQEGMSLNSLVKFKGQALEWLMEEMEEYEHSLVSDYLENPELYQDAEVQQELLKELKEKRKYRK